MPAVWDSKVTFVCFSILGVSLVLSLWICLWTLHNSKSYCLTWGKKKNEKSKRERKGEKKPPADFKPGQRVLLVFLLPQEEGSWTPLLSLPMVLRGWEPGWGPNIHSSPASGPGSLCAARLKSATQTLGKQ